jgi:hypothetical protein
MKRILPGILIIFGIIVILLFLFKNQLINAVPSISSSSTPPAKISLPTASVSKILSETQIKLFLIALDDQGKKGDKIGCGDSVVPFTLYIPKTPNPLSAAIHSLLSIKDSKYGSSGLYNALYQSNIKLDSTAVENGKIIIKLSGKFKLDGACDNPRVEAQLTQTALQFPGASEAVITLNGVPLKTALSLK